MILEFTAAAEADLEAIGDHIARDNPAPAVRFLRDLTRCCCQELAEMPQAWPVVPRYKHHGIRRRVHGRYLIFFRVGADRITILHVLNDAMDVDTFLLRQGSRRGATCVHMAAARG